MWDMNRLARLVREMRAAQRGYYRGRRKGTPEQVQGWLDEALRLEAAVDEALKEIDSALPLFDREIGD